MKLSKKIINIREPLDIDLQLVASELDTSVNDMLYLSKDILEDAISVSSFEKLCDDIEKGEGSEITSFSNNAILYEYLDEAVTIHTILDVKHILFDSLIRVKMENKMCSYN